MNLGLWTLYHHAPGWNRGLKTEPRGQLEGARATRAKDRTDPVIGLPKSKLILVRGTTGYALWVGLTRRGRTNESVQRAAVTGQVRNVVFDQRNGRDKAECAANGGDQLGGGNYPGSKMMEPDRFSFAVAGKELHAQGRGRSDLANR